MITFYHDIEQNYDSHADPTECRKMVNEFLKLEKKYNIPATYNIVGKLFKEQPDLIECISKEGQEVAFHSYNHQTDWNPEYFSNEIDLCRKVSPVPTGYRSPRSQINQSAVRTIWEKGFLWNAEGDHHTEPYFIYKGLVRLPITGDDWSLHLGKVTADKWVQNFSKLLKSRTYIAFGLHDYIASIAPEKILHAWEKILQIAIESNALLLNFSEAAELFRRAAMSRYIKFNKRNSKTSKFYITKAFEGIIKKEAEKLNKPVIANLFLGNKNLPLSFKEFAKEIYYVSIDSSVISDYESSDCLEMRDEEVSDSKSQKNFADLIICANSIEYQFWPDRLADEIKRIGKIGATFIVAFPSANRDFSSYDESVPERIKHYFTIDEINRWSNQIGPGNIICINDLIPEYNQNKLKEGNRISEQNSHKENQATNRVFIGTIQNKYIPPSNRRTISLSEATFRFPNPIYEHIRIILDRIGVEFVKPFRKVGKMVINWI